LFYIEILSINFDIGILSIYDSELITIFILFNNFNVAFIQFHFN